MVSVLMIVLLFREASETYIEIYYTLGRLLVVNNLGWLLNHVDMILGRILQGEASVNA